MALYRRGGTWWYKFTFDGQLVRESAKTRAKTIAREAEEQRKRELQNDYNGLSSHRKKGSGELFSEATAAWRAAKTGLTDKTLLGYDQRLVHILAAFGKHRVRHVDLQAIVDYREARTESGASGRTVNFEVGIIGAILKTKGLWGPIGERLKDLPENDDVGKALSPEDEERILAAIARSDSQVLLTAFIFARDSGLRLGEQQALRHRDLRLEWQAGRIVAGELVVRRSKTAAGTGRTVPLSAPICAALSVWLSRFPQAGSDSHLFPFHRVVQLKGGGARIIDIDLEQPTSWMRAWGTALKAAGVQHYRWHDLRHTFISRLAQNPLVSERTVMSLAGHVSKKMLETYAHIQVRAKREAIAALGIGTEKTLPHSGVGTKLGTVEFSERERKRLT
jgi:integrase